MEVEEAAGDDASPGGPELDAAAGDPSLSSLTRVGYPGWEEFGSWLRRADADRKRDGLIDRFMGVPEVSATMPRAEETGRGASEEDDGGAVEGAEAGAASDEGSVDGDVRESPSNGSAVDGAEEDGGIRETSSVASTSSFGGTRDGDWKNFDYELFDTPVWHERRKELLDQKLRRRRRKRSREEGKDEAASSAVSAKDEAKVDRAISQIDREYRYTTRVLVILIGVLMALVGLAIVRASSYLHQVKMDLAFAHLPEGLVKGFAVYLSMSVFYSILAFLVVAYRPIAAGSGIDHAKATLNGVEIPQCTDWITMLCKGVGVVLSSAASLPVGLEGPMIHSGMCLGSNIAFVRNIPWVIRSDRTRRDLAAVGTAAGVTASFTSPIGGVLFAMEEGASFWSTHLSYKCISGTLSCIVVYYLFVSIASGSGEISSSSILEFRGVHDPVARIMNPSFAWVEFFAFAVAGVLGGLVGALWNSTNMKLAALRRRLALGLPLKGLEVVSFTILMASLAWWLPTVMSICRNAPGNDSNFVRFNCPEGQYNELATLLLSPPDTLGLLHTFYAAEDAFSASACVVAGVIYLLVLLGLFGASIAMGIFIPLLYAGSCFGRAMAVALDLDTTTYAVLGAAAMLGGVVRAVISLTVIVLIESVGLPFYFVAPLLLTSISARATGNIFGKGVYDMQLDFKDVPFLEERAPEVLRHRHMRARDMISSRPLVKLPPEMQVSSVLQILKQYPQHSFPVVDQTRGQLFGAVSRFELLVLLLHKDLFYEGQSLDAGDRRLQQLSGRRCITHRELTKRYPGSPTLDEVEAALSEEDLDRFLDLTPCVQIATHTFECHGSGERAYELFRTLGLRSLLVVHHKSETEIIGEITRRDLHSFQD